MSVLARLLPERLPKTNADPRVGLDAAAAWLARAQDATGSGGVAANYDAAKRQWAGAYPETTGYIIETLLHYADFAGRPEYRERAIRMAAWESDIQLADGGVRAGTLDAQQVVPTIFNTGQVLFGWIAAWRATGEARFRDSLVRACDWLAAAQDDDGAWRKFASPFAAHRLNTYNTRVAFGLARAGKALGEARYVDAAARNVQWALTQQRPNGWLANNDLEDNALPLTHTIAYATRGILEVGVLAERAEFIETAANIARAVAQTQRPDGALPGRLDAGWKPAARWTCVTGNAQMAIVWQRLARETHDATWQPPADRAIAFSLSGQDPAHADPAIRGGLPGSWPRSGGYMRNRYPNWAAQFFMDAVLLKLGAD
jgi:uncharacterized protein YyaL (SSP411 family)